jgi:uncharacterized protein (TIGR02246 family)
MLDEARIHKWLEAYRHAWSTDDPDDVAALFTDDAVYFTAPFQQPLRGVDEIAAYWLGEKEAGIPWDFAPEVLAQEGDMFVVRAVTTYPEGTVKSDVPQVYHNLWLVTLDEDGRATEFVEYYMLAD